MITGPTCKRRYEIQRKLHIFDCGLELPSSAYTSEGMIRQAHRNFHREKRR